MKGVDKIDDTVDLYRVSIENFIDGVFQPAVQGQTIPVVDPSTGQTYINVASSHKADIDLAVQAAKQALPQWSGLSLEKRSSYLHAMADQIEKRLDEFAQTESRDNGKPTWLAKQLDIPRAIENFRFFANLILEPISTSLPREDDVQHHIIRQPVGVCGLITPWNLPIYLLTWKIAPALACGNTVVCKPSEMTPATAQLLCEVAQAVGLPKGVLNMVQGTGVQVGEPLVTHPDVGLISFTGGTATGKAIQKSIAGQIKKTSFELGGKNAMVIHADANIDRAVETAIKASFLNQGEICLCTERILIHESVYDDFVQRFVQQAKTLVVGDPKDSQSYMGPLVSKQHMQKVKDCIQAWVDAGAQILTGNEPLEVCKQNPEGYYVRPTVLAHVSPKHTLHDQEIFGPVVTLEPYHKISQAIDRVNTSPYGLCSSIFTQDAELALNVSTRIQTATVWVNTWLLRDLRAPFGGMKQSGIGREGGQYSLDFYSETKTICIKP